MLLSSITQLQEILKSDKGRILALDYGMVKIGIAISDELLITANAHENYKRRNMSKDLGHIGNIVKTQDVKAIILGLPLNLDGTEDENCQMVRHVANKLIKKTNLPLLLHDERFSTKIANKTMRELEIKGKRRHNIDDKIAATIILQDVLKIIKI